jgi:hypothetical protein
VLANIRHFILPRKPSNSRPTATLDEDENTLSKVSGVGISILGCDVRRRFPCLYRIKGQEYERVCVATSVFLFINLSKLLDHGYVSLFLPLFSFELS